MREIETRVSAGETLVVAAPALVEAYAVLTRLPAPHRLSPADSWALLDADFMADGVEIIALDVEAYQRLLHGAVEQGVVGGQIYDAVISACALAGHVDTIVTFNARHFVSLAQQGIKVVVPL